MLFYIDEVALFNVFEVFYRISFEFFSGIIIANNDGMSMHLQNADGPHMINTALNGVVQGSCFVGARCQNHNFFGITNCSDADG